MMPESTIGKLRVWAYLEGLSLIGLVFVCMPLKYYWNMPEAVSYVGALHGGLFIFYCMWLLVATLEFKWGIQTAALAFLAAILPGGTFVADRKIFMKYVEKKKPAEEPVSDD